MERRIGGREEAREGRGGSGKGGVNTSVGNVGILALMTIISAN